MEANRAKSRRSYRRHKLSIGAKKVVRYRAETRGHNRLIPGASRRRGPLGLDPETIPEWLALVQQVSDKFQAVTKPSTRAYVERLYQRYAISRRKDILSDAVLEFTGLQKTIQRCEAGLLQLVGVANEYRAAESVGKQVHEALQCVDDIICNSLCGYSEVVDMYRASQLMFQSLE
ncbi:hypothetical protein PC9H_004374 [Pleurotus ostreatus]|uniref:Uncharacterized protein n=1 Tax=Pleurotus ostreatus TaxID=5322 RepID=A0A8H7A2Q7_PLEOS|nr:uncharacterized protein PC9H_004374 [Pleurotus ostreatus]KAF7437532.1 hypothetical protein PC9H_004374 [Pleurotus ostreatus]